MTLAVEKNIAIVPVFDLCNNNPLDFVKFRMEIWFFYLEQVGDDAVSGAALNKVPLSCEELFRVELTKLLEEVF